MTLLTPRVLIPFIIVTLIWGSTWIVIRDQISSVPPTWSVTYRFAVAAAAMFLLAVLRREKLWPDGATIGFALILGLLQFALNFNFVYRAEAYVTSGIVAVIFALLIVPNTLLTWLWYRTPLSRTFLTGSAVAIAGIALLLVHEASSISSDRPAVILGVLMTLAGVISASIANVMQASAIARRNSMIVLLAWAMAWGAAANAVFALASAGAPVIDLRPAYILGVLYLGLFGSVICFPLYFSIIRAVGPGPAAWSSVLIPVVAMAISTVVENYVWSVTAAAGGMLAIAGLIIALRPGRAGTLASGRKEQKGETTS